AGQFPHAAGIGINIAVLDAVGRLPHARGSKVDRHHRLQPQRAGPRQELVGPDRVWFDRSPREVEATGTVGYRSDAVTPVIAGNEVAARVTDNRDAQLIDQVRDILAEPSAVGRGVVRLVNTGVDTTAHVLDEAAEDTRVDIADGEPGMNREFNAL